MRSICFGLLLAFCCASTAEAAVAYIQVGKNGHFSVQRNGFTGGSHVTIRPNNKTHSTNPYTGKPHSTARVPGHSYNTYVSQSTRSSMRAGQDTRASFRAGQVKAQSFYAGQYRRHPLTGTVTMANSRAVDSFKPGVKVYHDTYTGKVNRVRHTRTGVVVHMN